MNNQPALEKSGLKVLLCDSSPNWGGQEYRLLREAQWLHERGHKVLVVCGARSELALRLPRQAPGVQVEKMRSWGGLLGLLEFLWKVHRWSPDVIHAHSGQDALWASIFHFFGRTVVCSRHMTVPSRMKGQRKFCYRSGCSRVIASAEFIKRDLIAAVGIPESSVDVVGEGVDLKEFHPEANGRGFREEFGIPEDVLVFGIVAMIREEKGHAQFVKAAAKVRDQIPGARFVIVGDGQESRMEKLRRRVLKEFPLQPAPVIFTGYREDVPEIMAALDVLVVPSLREAQTLVIPQAFATGKPVIASLVGGIPEIVTHGRNGLMVTAGDVRDLAAAMVRLAESPDLRLRLGRAGLDLARQELLFDRKMELLLGSYRRAINRAPAGNQSPQASRDVWHGRSSADWLTAEQRQKKDVTRSPMLSRDR
ncbi:MAG: glycosyltransferase family 4 protein [Verrucomicrobiota bacterium]